MKRTLTAEVVERDGERILVIDAASPPDGEGYLAMWLIDADVVGMVAVGIVDGDRHESVLPEGLDLDVSIEPFDGDPAHSGDSIWRGALS